VTTVTPPTTQRQELDLFHVTNLVVTLMVVVPFFLVPLLLMFMYSFGHQDFVTGVIEFGWTVEAWKGLTEPLVLESLTRSLVLATVATVGCLIVGLPLAYFVARRAGRFATIALLLIIVPFWVSFIVRAYAWLDILGNQGPINRALLNVGLLSSPFQLVNNEIGIAIGIVYGYLPLMVFPIYVALERIDVRVLEAAHDLGATPARTFRRVTLPLALPGILAGCVLVWVPALGEYVIPTIMGGGKVYMIGNVIALRFGTSNWPFGAATAVAVMVLAVGTIWILFKLARWARLELPEAGKY
jgi:spermidine/putrescine transport system permease protein